MCETQTKRGCGNAALEVIFVPQSINTLSFIYLPIFQNTASLVFLNSRDKQKHNSTVIQFLPNILHCQQVSKDIITYYYI